MFEDDSQQWDLCERDILGSLRDAEAASNQRATAMLLNNLAVVYHVEGRFLDADLAHKRCVSVLESLGEPRSVAQSLANRAALYRTFGHYHEGERLFQCAWRLWAQHGRPLADEQQCNLEDTPEAVTAKMLWADVFQPNGLLRNYSREVQYLKSNPEALATVLNKLGPWYHDVQLTPRISTFPPNRTYVQNRWKYVAEFLAPDLTGKRVLDIGCNGGFFSLQMKRRQAREVVGIDIMPHCLAQARFVSHWFGEPIELRELSAYDVASLGEFDIVIFIGVLYHLRHPLYAIDQVASICKEVMYLQSVVRGDSRDFEAAEDYPQTEQEAFKQPQFPRMYFIEKSFNGDGSNWWVPNTSCLMAMARSAGFVAVQQSSHPEIIICRK